MTIATDFDRRIPPSTLQNRLRDAREWRGLEQSDIGDELGIARSTVSNYETGKTVPGKLVVNAWAAVCDVDVEWLRRGFGDQGGGGAAPPRGPGELSGKLRSGNWNTQVIAIRGHRARHIHRSPDRVAA